MVALNLDAERRPHGPPKNLIDVLHRLRERNLPNRVDAGYLLAAGVSENLVRHAEFALEFLGLTDASGEPTEALRTMTRATDEEYRGALETLLRERYDDVFQMVDPSSDDPSRISNAFRRYSPASQRARMVTFFLALCREAGIPVLDAARQPNGPNARPRGPQRQRKVRATVAPRTPAVVASSAPIEKGIRESLRFLIDMLPPEGHTLSKERRDQWLAVALEALKFAYPENGRDEDRATEELNPIDP